LSCAVFNVGVFSTAQAIFAIVNEFIESHGFDWMKYKAVATNGNGAATLQRSTNGAVRTKTFPLTVFQSIFWGFFGHRPKFFEMNEKT